MTASPSEKVDVAPAGCPISHTDYRLEEPIFGHYAKLNAEREQSDFLLNDSTPDPFYMIQRFDHVLEALRRGHSIEEVHRRTSIDPWFLREFAELVAEDGSQHGAVRTFKSVDTCAAEFAAQTPYFYSGWERPGPDGPRHEVQRGERPSEPLATAYHSRSRRERDRASAPRTADRREAGSRSRRG